jgi:hypothetical protein
VQHLWWQISKFVEYCRDILDVFPDQVSDDWQVQIVSMVKCGVAIIVLGCFGLLKQQLLLGITASVIE